MCFYETELLLRAYLTTDDIMLPYCMSEQTGFNAHHTGTGVVVGWCGRLLWSIEDSLCDVGENITIQMKDPGFRAGLGVQTCKQFLETALRRTVKMQCSLNT